MKNAVMCCMLFCLPFIAIANTTTVIAPPPNDDCVNAITITPGTIVNGTTIDATTDAGPGLGCSGTGYAESVWYRFIGTGNPMYVSTCNSNTNFDTEISVLTKPAGAPESFPICSFYTCVAGNDNGANAACFDPGTGAFIYSVIDEFETVLGKEYLIRISTGSLTGTGNFEMEFDEVSLAPISLQNFWGEAQDQGNAIAWETASESNVLWHIIESSPDGVSNWGEVGRLVSETSAERGAFYELIDRDPYNSTYYRLRTQDYDNSEQFSEVIKIKRDKPEFAITNVFPNPVMEGNVTFQIDSDRNEDIRVRIMDLSGKTVDRFEHQVRDGLNDMQIDVTNWRSGVYFVQFESRQGYFTKKIFKQE